MEIVMSHHSSCSACAFFEDHASNGTVTIENAGLCRFNPPVTQPSAEARGFWPIVANNDWCGHFANQMAAE